MSTIIPLFPLPSVVLFPGMLLPLHIFEPRYRQMIKDAMATDGQFGLLLCREYDADTLNGVPFDVGTVADIREVDILADGRMNILTEGTRRFQVVSYDFSSQPYIQGQVMWLDDPPDELVSPDLMAETAYLFEEALRMTQKLMKLDPDIPPLPDDPAALSFTIAERLKGGLGLKQEILELLSATERLTFEREFLGKVTRTLAAKSQIEDAFQSG